jgi:transcriptional regulator with XRE-family HTH domain
MSSTKYQKNLQRKALAAFLTKIKDLTGKSDLQIANEIGTRQVNVRRWRLGEVVPPAPTLRHIAAVYGTTDAELGAANVVDGSGIPAALKGNKKRAMELFDGLLRSGDDALVDHLVRQIELLTDLNRRRKQ